MISTVACVTLLFAFLLTSPTAAFVPSRALLFSQRTIGSPLRMSSSSSSTKSYHPEDWERPEDRSGKRVSEEPPKSKFVTGDELQLLRQKAMSLRQELHEARRMSATRRVHELERVILQVQQVDAEFVYAVALERMEAAQHAGSEEDVQRFREQAMEARAALPQFNMEGLWVGKYGESGYEMINVTYVGDTIVAYKVTGHSNVPRGEVSFQADLSPLKKDMLEPIVLEENAAEQWGAQYLPRFSGEGQVAAKGFRNAQYVDGQLILVNEYFSFAWVPLGEQVFFGRPSPELTLQMLKDADAPVSAEEKMRAHLKRCMEETDILQEEAKSDDDYFYSSNQADYYNQQGCFE